jgi:hypothetical protein
MPEISVNGTLVDYPNVGDVDWGNDATNFAILTSAALGKLGLASGTSVDIGQTLDVNGNTTLDANLSVGGNASVTGNTTLTGNLSVNGNSTLTGNLSVNGNSNLGNGTAGTFAPTDLTVDTNLIKTNSTDNYVGINTTTPTEALDVTGKILVSSDITIGGVIIADDSNNVTTAPPITFTGDTDTGIGHSSADTLDFVTGGNSRFRIESTGQIKAVYESQVGTDYNTQLDNGYLCRAWVNFNGLPATGTYSRTGTLITCTVTSHGLSSGQAVSLDFTTGTATDGSYIVTVTGVNTFEVTDTVSGSTSGNVTVQIRVRASGNVSSITDNTTGDYTVNFTTSIPDVNYTNIFGQQYDNSASASPYFMGIRAEFGVITTKTTSALRVCTANFNGTRTDAVDVNVAIFR